MVTLFARACVSEDDTPTLLQTLRTLVGEKSSECVDTAHGWRLNALPVGQAASVRELPLFNGVSPSDTHARGKSGVT